MRKTGFLRANPHLTIFCFSKSADVIAWKAGWIVGVVLVDAELQVCKVEQIDPGIESAHPQHSGSVLEKCRSIIAGETIRIGRVVPNAGKLTNTTRFHPNDTTAPEGNP